MRNLRTPARVMRAGALIVAVVSAFAVAHAAGVASASPIDIWVHDHSSDVIKSRPDGLAEIQATFGPVCGDNSNGARSYWPSQDANGHGYVYYDPYISIYDGGHIRLHFHCDHYGDTVS